MSGGENKYRDIAELGRGGMGEVFLCVASGMAGFSKLLVVKRLRPELADDPELLEMFLREARIAARLSHPNIVQTNDVGFDGKRHYMAMEYLDGQSLSTVLRRCRDEETTFPTAMHLRTLSEALSGLHYAHELADFDGTPLGIVHRDATPHNIFITYDGQVKLVDFGIAKVTGAGSPETTTGVLKGKVHYMAPEQIDSSEGKRPDRRADIFAVGVMLWEAATGARMWRGRSEPQIINLLMNGAIPRPRLHAPDMPERLEAIIEKALEYDPESRHATAAELQGELDAFLEDHESRTSPRDVGRFVDAQFADTRRHLRDTIEGQLKLARELPTAPILDLSDQRGQLTTREAESGSKIVVARPTGVRQATQRRSFYLAAAVALVATAAVIFAVRGRSAPTPPPVISSGASATAEAAVASSSASALDLTMIPLAAPTPTTSATVVASVAAPGASYVALSLDAVPKNATLLLDGVRLAANPTNARYVRDGATHKVSAEAPGYVAKSQWIVFDAAEAKAHLVLVPGGPLPAPSPLSPSASATVAPPQPTVTAQPSSSSSGQAKVPIDKGDPWDVGK